MFPSRSLLFRDTCVQFWDSFLFCCPFFLPPLCLLARLILDLQIYLFQTFWMAYFARPWTPISLFNLEGFRQYLACYASFRGNLTVTVQILVASDFTTVSIQLHMWIRQFCLGSRPFETFFSWLQPLNVIVVHCNLVSTQCSSGYCSQMIVSDCEVANKLIVHKVFSASPNNLEPFWAYITTLRYPYSFNTLWKFEGSAYSLTIIPSFNSQVLKTSGRITSHQPRCSEPCSFASSTWSLLL